MQTKVLIIAHVRSGESFLFRKKPDGSPPYVETWYSFGVEPVAGEDIDETLIAHVRQQTGVTVRVTDRLWWDSEVKADLDGKTKQFIYLSTICDYVSGELAPAEGIERLEWIPQGKLHDYAIVPPSVKFLQRLDVW